MGRRISWRRGWGLVIGEVEEGDLKDLEFMIFEEF